MKNKALSTRVSAPALALAAALALNGCASMNLSSDATKSASADPAVTVYTMKNGMRVLIREDHFAPVAALQVWVGAGGADERDIELGVAHVHEHMLFKGTSNRGVGEIASEIESSGGRINAWTSWNETVYHIVVASRFADTGLEVLADAVQNSSFDPGELEKELGVVLEEWKRGEDSPSRQVFQELFGTAFTQHPYRRPVIGTEDSIKGLDRTKILDFFQRYYAPNNMTVVVVGDVDTKHVRKVIEKSFGSFEARDIDRPARLPEPVQTEMRFSSDTMDVREAHMALGWHVPGANHPDAPLLDLLAFVVGGAESSRLYKRLVVDDQSAQSIGAFAYTPPDPGLFVVTSSLEAPDVERAYKAIVEEITQVRSELVDAEELERARVNLESDFVFRYETVQGQAREVGYFLTVHDDPDYDSIYLDRIRSATLDDLQRIATKYLTRDNMTVVTLLPTDADATLSEGEALAAALPLNAPTPAGESAAIDAIASAVSGVAGTVADKDDEDAHGESKAELITLENGVRLIIKEHRDVPVFSLRAAMLGGVLAEIEATNGISNFTAEMLTRGTTERSREQFTEDVESLAGGLGGFSGHNSLGLSGSFLAGSYDEALELFLEALNKPAFDEAEFAKAQRELLLAIKNREDNTSRVAFDLTFKTVYPDHPYGLTTLGDKESVENLTTADLRAFWDKALHPSNLVVAIVGDVDAAKVKATLGTALAKLEPKPESFTLPPEATLPRNVREGTKEIERQQAHVVVGYPSVDVKDPDRYPLAVLDNILSGQSGRLFLELRDKQSLAYSVTSFFTKGLARGLFGGYIATDPTNVDRALDGLLGEFERVRTATVSDDELSRSKRYIIGSRAISLQTNGSMAEEMAFNELYGLGYLDGENFAERIGSVTAADVQRVASKYLDPAIRSEIVVGPDDAVASR